MKGRLNRESNPVPGEKPGFLPQHESETSGEFVVTGESNPFPVKIKNTDEQAIPVKLTGSVVKYRNIDRIALEPAETIRVVDNERKLLPNIYIFFKTAPNASNTKVSIHSRINPGGRYVNAKSIEINHPGTYKKIHLKNGDVTNLYVVEFTNLSDSPIEIYDILIVEEL